MAYPATARPLRTEAPNAGGDEVDGLFDYDAGGVNDILSENYQSTASKETPKESTGKGKSGATLGIDEEVEVTRKPRAPRVKLDENRLLSANGIPKLRKKAKDHLKFKGRGHEYSDASKLLSFYQLWLDDLFPKARFLDALSMVEKMGHKKVMQSARMEWINEGKSRSSVHEDSLFDEPALPTRENGDREKTAQRVAPIFEKDAERLKTPVADVNMIEDDIYDATPRSTREKPAEGADSQDSIFGGEISLFGPAKTANVDNDIPEDELDALFTEEKALKAASGNKHPVGPALKATPAEENFDDEMEAMAEMEGMW